jgi:50S ribosomal protein L3, bacterial
MAMKEALLGRKKGMTQVFGDDGSMIPVTVVEAGPCTVVGVRTKASHGYDALQIGFETARKKVTKAMAGHYKKAGVDKPMKVLREVRLQKTEAVAAYQPGQTLTVELFAAGEFVDVVGVTKGKGFQGGVKRHGWSGGDATHGSMFHRAPGSIGASSDPSRVWPGPQAAGADGRRSPDGAQPSRGAGDCRAEPHPPARRVPGHTGSIVLVRKSVKQTKAQQQKAKEAK